MTVVSTGTFGELAGREYSVVRSDCSTGKKQAVHVLDPFVHFGDLSRDSRYAFFSKKEDQAVYDTVTGKKVFAVRAPGVFRFSADGSALVAYSGKEVHLWEVPSGKELRRFTFKSNYLVPGYDVGDCLSLSPDKKMLAVGFLPGSIFGAS